MLKEEREKKGMTITELAEKSNVCRDTINKIGNKKGIIKHRRYHYIGKQML